ncbi:MAG: glycosyltransferase [Bacillota bacterium]|nr:glycosyltransferase [Bacillota bacterium]
MSDLLSVIVPVYNACDYLEELINSLLNQSYENIELILVDDGSKDCSGLICDSFAEKDSRCKVFHKKNGGQSSARNVGLEKAKGKYIAFADNDDIIHPQMYSDIIQAMKNENADVGACQFKNVQNQDIPKLSFEKNKPVFVEKKKKELLDNFLKPSWWIPIWNKVYSKELIKSLRFGNYHLGEDNMFSYQVIDKCNKYIYTNNTYYFQRMHGLNYEFTAKEYMIDLLKAKEYIVRDIQFKYKESYESCREDFLYEAIRIYNGYFEQDSKTKKEILKMIGDNSKHIFATKISIGRKILFFKIRYMPKLFKNKQKILI